MANLKIICGGIVIVGVCIQIVVVVLLVVFNKWQDAHPSFQDEEAEDEQAETEAPTENPPPATTTT